MPGGPTANDSGTPSRSVATRCLPLRHYHLHATSNRSEPADLDVAVFGVPFDLDAPNRPGARFGPRIGRN